MKKSTIIECEIIVLLVIILVLLSFKMIQLPNRITNFRLEGEPLGGFPFDDLDNKSNGVVTIKTTEVISDKTYESTEYDENALVVEDGGTVTATNINIIKKDDSYNVDSDVYGTNAGILVNNDGVLNISNATIETDGKNGNGLFVFGTGVATISDSTIKTSKNKSGGIMVTAGGTLSANNLNIETQGISSAAIRSDRGGGLLTVDGGTYITHGKGSPAIYSTANIVVSNAKLISTKAQGAIIDGINSITLDNVELEDTNTELKGNSETFQNIFIHRSGPTFPGEENKEAVFTASNSKIVTNNGDTIFVTNAKAVINLINNELNNTFGGDLIRIQAGKWGIEGENGGSAILNLSKQKAIGNVVVDNISNLEMNLSDNSYYEGTINGDNQAKNIILNLDSTSKIKLTGDSYVNSLVDKDASYSNIDFNGYKLYVNRVEINK